MSKLIFNSVKENLHKWTRFKKFQKLYHIQSLKIISLCFQTHVCLLFSVCLSFLKFFKKSIIQTPVLISSIKRLNFIRSLFISFNLQIKLSTCSLTHTHVYIHHKWSFCACHNIAWSIRRAFWYGTHTWINQCRRRCRRTFWREDV